MRNLTICLSLAMASLAMAQEAASWSTAAFSNSVNLGYTVGVKNQNSGSGHTWWHLGEAPVYARVVLTADTALVPPGEFQQDPYIVPVTGSEERIVYLVGPSRGSAFNGFQTPRFTNPSGGTNGDFTLTIEPGTSSPFVPRLTGTWQGMPLGTSTITSGSDTTNLVFSTTALPISDASHEAVYGTTTRFNFSIGYVEWYHGQPYGSNQLGSGDGDILDALFYLMEDATAEQPYLLQIRNRLSTTNDHLEVMRGFLDDIASSTSAALQHQAMQTQAMLLIGQAITNGDGGTRTPGRDYFLDLNPQQFMVPDYNIAEQNVDLIPNADTTGMMELYINASSWTLPGGVVQLPNFQIDIDLTPYNGAMSVLHSVILFSINLWGAFALFQEFRR